MKPTESETPVMWVPGMNAFLNRWFARYEDARTSLKAERGYLFPYQHQFFITESEGVRELGLDPEDPDWEHIGWDWVRPLDRTAWDRLKEKRSRQSVSPK